MPEMSAHPLEVSSYSRLWGLECMEGLLQWWWFLDTDSDFLMNRLVTSKIMGKLIWLWFCSEESSRGGVYWSIHHPALSLGSKLTSENIRETLLDNLYQDPLILNKSLCWECVLGGEVMKSEFRGFRTNPKRESMLIFGLNSVRSCHLSFHFIYLYLKYRLPSHPSTKRMDDIAPNSLQCGC